MRFGWHLLSSALVVALVWMVATATSVTRPAVALSITLCFAVAARTLRGVTVGGAMAGFLATAVLLLRRGGPMFGAVLLVFVMTYTATRFRHERKATLGISDRTGGRDAKQVLANLGCAALAAAAAGLPSWQDKAIVGSVAALAEAAGDTVASEIGKAWSDKAWLVTSGEYGPAGRDGAISVAGTVTGIAATCVIGVEAAVSGLLTWPDASLAVAAGVSGVFLDSLLGATLEQRGWLTNNGVNFVSTAWSAAAGALASAALSYRAF